MPMVGFGRHTRDRIEANPAVTGFPLTPDEVARIDRL